MHSTRNVHLTMELVSEQLTKGNRSKIPASPIEVRGCRISSVNNACSSEYKPSITTSRIPTPPQKSSQRGMRRAAQNNKTKMHRPERPNIVVDKTNTAKRRTAPIQTKNHCHPKGKESNANGKQAKVPTTRPSAPKKAGEVQRMKRTECGKAQVRGEPSTGRSRRGTVITLVNHSPESQLRRHSKPIQNTQKANTTAPTNQKPTSSTTSKDKPELVRGKAQKSSSFKTLKKAGDGGVSSQVPSPQTKDKDKDLVKTPHPMVKVVVQPPPPTTTQKAPSSDLKPELSLWKRIKKMSSVKITSAWKTDQKLEMRKNARTERKGPQKHEQDCSSSERPSSNTIPNLIDRPSTTKSSSIAHDDSVSTIDPMSAKNDPVELPPLTPRSLTDSLNQVQEKEEEEDSPQVLTDSSDLSPKALSCVMENGGEPSSEGESHDVSDYAPPNPPPLTQFESCSVQCPEKLQEGDSSSISSSPVDQPTCKTPTTHGSMIFESMSSESPDLLLISNSENSDLSQRYGPLHLPNMPSMENNLDCIGTQSSRSQLRRVDSARIGAQCEFLRDTIKEESRRVMSMTSLLEALNRGPRNSAKKKKNLELAQTRELNKRQAEKIHDLEMENQHLRQLLEFSIGSIRRPSWRQGHAPDGGQGYGDAFNSPVPTTDQADNELDNRISQKNKQSKRRKGKKSNAEIERIDRLQRNLESKDTLLKVITNSICQISSMHGYYQKRLEDLERDRNNIQEERSEHLNELLRFGIDLRADEIDAHKQRA